MCQTQEVNCRRAAVLIFCRDVFYDLLWSVIFDRIEICVWREMLEVHCCLVFGWSALLTGSRDLTELLNVPFRSKPGWYYRVFVDVCMWDPVSHLRLPNWEWSFKGFWCFRNCSEKILYEQSYYWQCQKKSQNVKNVKKHVKTVNAVQKNIC